MKEGDSIVGSLWRHRDNLRCMWLFLSVTGEETTYLMHRPNGGSDLNKMKTRTLSDEWKRAMEGAGWILVE